MNKSLQKVQLIIKHNFHYTHLLYLPVYQPAHPFTIVHTEFFENDRAQWYHVVPFTHRVNKNVTVIAVFKKTNFGPNPLKGSVLKHTVIDKTPRF